MTKRIGKIILIVLAVLAMFIPTYIAIANYSVLGSWQNTLTEETTVMSVKDGDGVTVFRGTAGEQSNKALAQTLANLLENGKVIRNAPEVAATAEYTVTAQLTNKSQDYQCRYIPSGPSYLFDVEANVCYEIASADMLSLLQRFFYGETAESLSVPTLITAGSEITPSYISWYHKNKQGDFGEVMNLPTVSEEETYPVNKNISIRFSPEPDVATIKVYDGSNQIFHGDYEAFTGLSYEDSVNLTVMIQAKWEKSTEHDYYGEASYQFYVNYSATPAFAVSTTKATVGDYFTINVLNTADPDSITVRSEPDLGCTPVFYRDGEYVRALVPLHAGLKGGVYRVTVSTKGAEETFEITLEDRSPLSRSYDAGTDLIARARNTAAMEEYRTLLRDIGNTRSTTKYFSGSFIDYHDSASIGAIILLGYGHFRTLADGESYQMDGVDFMIYRGTDIPALNNGMVISTGQNAYLGNYVIVDHGLGLRTWYCHLSEVSVSVGDTVKSAQAIGKSGNTGFTTGSGVYLICTVGETPISPYTLWTDGVVCE